MLELRNVSKSYGENRVLHDVSMKLDGGLTYGLIGVNGAGKTTLMKIVKRLTREHAGGIYLCGEDITRKDANDVPVGFVCDTPAFFSDLSMEEHMLLVCRSRGLKRKEALDRIEGCADRLGLAPYFDYYPRALSRGTQQRFNVALSFLGDFVLNLYDEPFITLDPIQVANLEEEFLDRKGKGITQIISSHNLESLERVCDDYLVLHGGDIDLFSKEDIDRGWIMRCLDESDCNIP